MSQKEEQLMEENHEQEPEGKDLIPFIIFENECYDSNIVLEKQPPSPRHRRRTSLEIRGSVKAMHPNETAFNEENVTRDLLMYYSEVLYLRSENQSLKDNIAKQKHEILQLQGAALSAGRNNNSQDLEDKLFDMEIEVARLKRQMREFQDMKQDAFELK